MERSPRLRDRVEKGPISRNETTRGCDSAVAFGGRHREG